MDLFLYNVTQCNKQYSCFEIKKMKKNENLCNVLCPYWIEHHMFRKLKKNSFIHKMKES
jgi:hypothetical protein